MFKVIAFDFDGTLADSVELCLAVFDRVFALHLPDRMPSREALLQKFGMNEQGILEQFIGRRSPEAEEDFLRFHRELHPAFAPVPLPGIVRLLEELGKRNVHLCVITGRSRGTGMISLEYLKLTDFFEDFQFGAPFSNDKALQMGNLLKKYALAPEELAYVGDAVSDAEACRRAGVACLSAAWAKTAQREKLENINPGLVFSSPEELLRRLEEKSLVPNRNIEN